MEKPYKRLLGNRVFLSMPPKTENKILLTKEAKDEVAFAERKKLQKLIVYDVGDAVNLINIGDEVMVNIEALARAPIIELGNGLDDVIMVSPVDIIIIW